MRGFLVSGILIAFAATAQAQVGHTPESSPYLDLERSQEWTILYGHVSAHHDDAGVAPQGGMLTGLHYEWRFAGPAHLIAEAAYMDSQRLELNPADTGKARTIGTIKRPLYSFDASIGMNLTGAKTWHHLVPEARGGIGVISDLRAVPDSGGYQFGTHFAFLWGAGVRWIPGGSEGRFQLRGDITNRVYTISYPATFQSAPVGGTAIIPSDHSLSSWTNNPAFTIGISYLVGR